MACFTTVLCQCRIVQLIHSNGVKMYLTVKITSIGYSSTHYTLHNVAQTTLPWYTTDYGNLQLQIILERSRTCINISLWSSPAPWYALKAEFWISQRKLYMNTCVHLYNSIQTTNHWMHILRGGGGERVEFATTFHPPANSNPGMNISQYFSLYSEICTLMQCASLCIQSLAFSHK